MNPPSNEPSVQNLPTRAPMTQISVHRQVFQLMGTNIRTFDNTGGLLCFAYSKAFKLREEVNFYSDESKSTVLFIAKARNIIDFSPTFDMSTLDGRLFGSLQREGVMSTFAQDTWKILDANGTQVGSIVEDDVTFGILRRQIDFLTYFMPQEYIVSFGTQEVARIKQRKNPFATRYDYSIDSAQWESYRLLFLAIANMLALIEARQN